MYPHTPDSEIRHCDVCGGDPAMQQTEPGACTCLECPQCGTTGDPGCSLNGGTECQSGPPPHCSEGCQESGLHPCCHCQSCGGTDRYLTEDGDCAECLKAAHARKAAAP